jgi:hypothetical protein
MTMNDMMLPAPAGPLPLKLNLELVEALEEAGGSLLKLADRLVAHELKIGEMLPLLRLCYRRAGCALEGEALESFILSRTPAALTASLLMNILSPLQDMGAVAVGEPARRGL